MHAGYTNNVCLWVEQFGMLNSRTAQLYVISEFDDGSRRALGNLLTVRC